MISTDRVRKELAGLPARSHAGAAAGLGIHTPAWTDRTYREVLHRAEALLTMGRTVVLDATWADESTRALAVALAERTSSELVQLRCDLPEEAATQRIAGRDGISDADAVVAASLRAGFDDWPAASRVDTRPPVDLVVAQVQHRIQPWRTALTTSALRPCATED